MQNKELEIRLAADIQGDSTVDGPGLRTVIWTQGCPHHCPGCQNPQTWDPDGGLSVPISLVLEEIDKQLDYQAGVTFSGGDPMYQPEACNEIAKHCKEKGLTIWTYTGYTFEELMEMSKEKPIYREFLSNIDVLVDGRFMFKELDLTILFRGSRNQRLIDVQKTLETGTITLFDEKEYNEEESFKRKPIYV